MFETMRTPIVDSMIRYSINFAFSSLQGNEIFMHRSVAKFQKYLKDV